MEPDVIHVALAVADRFDECGVRYAIGGSVASSILGESRTTLDVDFLADVHLEHVDALASSFQPPFVFDAELAKDAIRRQRIFNILHIKSGIKADIHVHAYTGFERNQMDRALKVKLRERPDGYALIASAEDMVVQKLRWYRMGDCISDRQWRDVAGLLRVQGARLDVGYMREWSARLRVDDLLERALRETGLTRQSESS